MLDEEEQKIVNRVADNCQLLYDGYTEKVEYVVDVIYHRAECVNRNRMESVPDVACTCPVAGEKRVRQVRRPGLLRQLRDFAANKDTDRSPKAERGAPRVKVPGRPPGDMANFLTLDEIECAIPLAVDRALEEAGRDRTWAASPVSSILIGLSGQVSYLIGAGRPDIARDLDKALQGWVRQARETLRITVGDAMFSTVVCGNCGGGLSTPWGNRGDHDVRCVGTPSSPPCGETYPVSEWLRLYEDHKRRQTATGRQS